jgi:hypothetical protein
MAVFGGEPPMRFRILLCIASSASTERYSEAAPQTIDTIVRMAQLFRRT